jgi:hypothetical protein
MEILELKDGAAADNGHSDKTDFMNLRRRQPREKLVSAAAKPASEYQPAIDSLMRELVNLLPKSDAIWPFDDRAKWLRLAAGMFDLGYKASHGENKKIRITVVSAEPDQDNR